MTHESLYNEMLILAYMGKKKWKIWQYSIGSARQILKGKYTTQETDKDKQAAMNLKPIIFQK